MEQNTCAAIRENQSWSILVTMYAPKITSPSLAYWRNRSLRPGARLSSNLLLSIASLSHHTLISCKLQVREWCRLIIAWTLHRSTESSLSSRECTFQAILSTALKMSNTWIKCFISWNGHRSTTVRKTNTSRLWVSLGACSHCSRARPRRKACSSH